MTIGITQFIRLCLDDDEMVAEACIDAAHEYEVPLPDGAIAIAQHISQHDPVRVIGEVKGKRWVLDHHGPECAAGDECPTLRGLAVAWSDHPDYNAAWKLPT